MSAELQRETKLRDLRAAMMTQGLDLEGLPEIGWIASPRSTRYRNRMRLRVGEDGLPTFFNNEKSDACVVVETSVLTTIHDLRALATERSTLLRPLRHLEVRSKDAEGRGSVHLVVDESRSHLARGVAHTVTECLPNLIVGASPTGDETLPHQRYWLTDQVYALVPLGGFLQVNPGVNRALVRHVCEGANRRGVESFADLYCGSGNFALPLAAEGRPGRAVERDATAIDKLRRAATAQGMEQLRAHAGDAVALSTRWRSEGAAVDLVVLDPPRAGIREGLSEVAALAKRYIVLCSCNPRTLARDVSFLVSSGFSIEEVTAFDMFPHTAHLEVVVWMRGRNAS